MNDSVTVVRRWMDAVNWASKKSGEDNECECEARLHVPGDWSYGGFDMMGNNNKDKVYGLNADKVVVSTSVVLMSSKHPHHRLMMSTTATQNDGVPSKPTIRVKQPFASCDYHISQIPARLAFSVEKMYVGAEEIIKVLPADMLGVEFSVVKKIRRSCVIPLKNLRLDITYNSVCEKWSATIPSTPITWMDACKLFFSPQKIDEWRNVDVEVNAFADSGWWDFEIEVLNSALTHTCANILNNIDDVCRRIFLYHKTSFGLPVPSTFQWVDVMEKCKLHRDASVYITHKYDGTRVWAGVAKMIRDGIVYPWETFLFSPVKKQYDMILTKSFVPHLDTRFIPTLDTCDLIYDCEMVCENASAPTKIVKLFAFDVIKCPSHANAQEMVFSERRRITCEELSSHPFILVKPFLGPYTSIPESIVGVVHPSTYPINIPTDGVIIQLDTRETVAWKWKPLDKCTIDVQFIARRGGGWCVDQTPIGSLRLGNPPNSVILSLSEDEISLRPQEGSVHEFLLVPTPNAHLSESPQIISLKYVRARPDRPSSNSKKTVNRVLQGVLFPVELDEIAGSKLTGFRKASNHLKGLLLEKHVYGHSRVLCDVGTGRGGDINKWAPKNASSESKKIEFVYAIEPNKETVQELMSRLKKSSYSTATINSGMICATPSERHRPGVVILCKPFDIPLLADLEPLTPNVVSAFYSMQFLDLSCEMFRRLKLTSVKTFLGIALDSDRVKTNISKASFSITKTSETSVITQFNDETSMVKNVTEKIIDFRGVETAAREAGWRVVVNAGLDIVMPEMKKILSADHMLLWSMYSVFVCDRS